MQDTRAGDVTTTADTLKELIQTAKEGESGFRSAAQDCTDTHLKELFMRLSYERGSFVRELEPLIAKQSGDTDVSDSLAGAIHRGWMRIRSAVSTRSNLAVLEECERGESYAEKEYDAALKGQDLGEARDHVQRQHDRVVIAHREVTRRRDLLAAKA